MPVDLPVSAPLAAIAAPPAGLRTSLRAPYSATQRLLQSPVLWLDIQAPQGRMPAGLAALLERWNPHLSRVGWRALRAPLLTQDRATLQAVADEGWLSHAPQLWLSDADAAEAADTDILPGLQARTTIVAAVDPTEALYQIHPWAQGADPVMIRWLVLLHEAGHTERGQLAQPIGLPGWSDEASVAFNALVWENGDLMAPVRDRFDEAFADAFGARVLLQMAHNAPAARSAVAYLAEFRDAETARRAQHQVVTSFDDGHGDGGPLRALLAEAFTVQTPDQVRHAAQQAAGEAVLAWLQVQPGTATLLTWTRSTNPDLAGYRLHDYLAARQLAYVITDEDRDPPAPAPTASPLLQAAAAEDMGLRESFRVEVPAASRAALLAFLQAHTPPAGALTEGGADPQREDPAFEDWINRHTQLLLEAHHDQLAADQARLAHLGQVVEGAMNPVVAEVGMLSSRRRRSP